MAHARLRKLVLVDFGLEPLMFFCKKSWSLNKVSSVLTSVENEDVVHDTFLAITFTTTKDDEELAELC